MHGLSTSDRAFREDFTADRVSPAQFDHRAQLTHYSPPLLFSPQARSAFIEPDIQPIARPQ